MRSGIWCGADQGCQAPQRRSDGANNPGASQFSIKSVSLPLFFWRELDKCKQEMECMTCSKENVYTFCHSGDPVNGGNVYINKDPNQEEGFSRRCEKLCQLDRPPRGLGGYKWLKGIKRIFNAFQIYDLTYLSRKVFQLELVLSLSPL